MSTTDTSDVRRIAAFSQGDKGGNPAGVLVGDDLPCDARMQAIAGAVGYSETAFAAPEGDHWRVRYFAPDCEVAFCGHATIALGAVLTELNGPGTYPLRINGGEISVAGRLDDAGQLQIELSSPPTHSDAVESAHLEQALALFGLHADDLDPRIPPAIASAGNDHLVLSLRHREDLTAMAYDLVQGREFMAQAGLTTINLIWVEDAVQFHSRNAFAIGGVVEDPATGAAAAAFAGYLRDLGWPHGGSIDITQGADMGMPSKLKVTLTDERGAPVLVSGASRAIRQDLGSKP